VGEGPRDLVFLDQWYSNVDGLWRVAPLARFVERLAAFARVILLDKRGTGISDPVPLGGLPTLEEWMDDIRAVLDAVGSERAALISGVGASYLTLLFAATHPDRCTALVLVDGYARLSGAPGYLSDVPEVMTASEAEAIRSSWGRGILLQRLAPGESRKPALIESFSEYERQSASPAMAVAMLQALYAADLRHVLPAIRVPTLVITHADSARIPLPASRYLAEHIGGARHVELPGSENLIWAGDQVRMAAELQEFLTGVRPMPEAERLLATVLFTDIVGSTERAAALGDHAWRELLERHYAVVREQLERFRGRQVVTTGDGLLATFDGPARAIRCAQAIQAGVRDLGLDVRAGLHTGEIELAGSDVRGIAVHIGARISALAVPAEVLVSSTVKDLVVGSGIDFEDRGVHALKGVPGEWRLYSVRT
jgi:class 3 adenylate cyclase/pimeloyl-ACP methyl ester carboxylesterase